MAPPGRRVERRQQNSLLFNLGSSFVFAEGYCFFLCSAFLGHKWRDVNGYFVRRFSNSGASIRDFEILHEFITIIVQSCRVSNDKAKDTC